MDPLVNTLISVGAGFVAGIFAEPIKTTLSDAVKKRRLRRRLYQWAARTHSALFSQAQWLGRVTFEPDITFAIVKQRLDEIDLEPFSYWYAQDRHLLYLLRDEGEAMKSFYEGILSARNAGDGEEQRQRIAWTLYEFRCRRDEGVVNNRWLKRLIWMNALKSNERFIRQQNTRRKRGYDKDFAFESFITQ